MATLEELESVVKAAQVAVEYERARLQRECPHKYEDLTFDYSGVSAYASNGDVAHRVRIRCKCGRVFNKDITIYADL